MASKESKGLFCLIVWVTMCHSGEVEVVGAWSSWPMASEVSKKREIDGCCLTLVLLCAQDPTQEMVCPMCRVCLPTSVDLIHKILPRHVKAPFIDLSRSSQLSEHKPPQSLCNFWNNPLSWNGRWLFIFSMSWYFKSAVTGHYCSLRDTIAILLFL